MEQVIRIPVVSDADVALARLKGRAMANDLGFSAMDVTLITAAISEMTRNLVYHAHRGEVVLDEARHGRKRGMKVWLREEPAAAQHIHPSLRPKPQTRRGPGPDVSRVENMVDEFEMVKAAGGGTTITAIKWLP